LTPAKTGKSVNPPGASWAVHFAGDQEIKWALDEDLRWARRALNGDVRPVSVWRSRIVHAAWWPSAWRLGADTLRHQTVVCFADNAPSFYARQPEFHVVSPLVDKWIARSTQALRQFATFGIQAELAPYCADPQTFLPLPESDADLQALRHQLGLPDNAYLIGNFHSDTAFTIGSDRPKWQKGPDIFAEIVRQVREAEPRVCVLLAGPRRHWLRERLKSLNVPVCFVGREMAGDDFASNILGRTALNRLYNLLDLYLVCSRWEGGPHSILEACFSKTKILSTRVGIAEDILEEVSLFDTVPEAVSRILDDVRSRALEPAAQLQYERVIAGNSPARLSEALSRIYERFPRQPKKGVLEASAAWLHSHGKRLFRRRCRPPTIIGMIPAEKPGTLFEFLYRVLRQSDAVQVREQISAGCGHYLIDANWLRANDPNKLAAAKLIFVCDQFPIEALPSTSAMVVPSFEVLSEELAGRTAPRPLVIPPVLEGTSFDLNIPVPQQLTSTVAGVAQAIRQLFVVLNSPEDVEWLGFR
jgi:glycosyltransferase involved in cell wall biosynthesis